MRRFFWSVVLLISFLPFVTRIVSAAEPTPTPTPASAYISCALDPKLGPCPKSASDVFGQSQYYKGEKCVENYEEFIKNPLKNHYWVIDREVTDQGKADERARQFIYWVLNNQAIDSHPVIRTIWRTTQNVAIFLFLLVAALLGLGFILGQRSNFQLKIQVWPTLSKITTGLIYIVMSYAILIFFIQISEILMKFFIETLGGDKLFNIYFTGETSNEKSYATFVGCRDLNYTVQEAANAEIMLLKITNVTYYVMGVMLLLRKILLWFLIFVSPFLALLMPFIFIRNTGWIWIGVFFQWTFYGPLYALFLGAMATIWAAGIPFPFDFSRTNNVLGYIYPTAINLVYGGPAQILNQKISYLNNGNYVDTFAEYIITLIMQWAVVFFPWWLLRIFRDYCCDGIMAMKNVLMSMYDKMSSAPPPKPPAPTAPHPSSTGTALKLPKQIEVPIRVNLETMEQIKKTRTEDITKSLNLSMSKLTDIARFETNKQTHESVRKNLDYLAHPTKAETPAERQKFMNIRTELFSRTIRQDRVAQQVLTSISSNRVESSVHRTELLRTVPHIAPVAQTVSTRINLPHETISTVNSSFVQSVANNTHIVNSIAQSTNAPVQQVQSVLNSYKNSITESHPSTQIVSNISQQTGVTKESVTNIIQNLGKTVTNSTKQTAPVLSTTTVQTPQARTEAVVRNEVKQVMQTVAQQHQVKVEDVQKVVTAPIPVIAEPAKNIEQAVSIPPSISIEDYEEVKKMWTQQYEKGEVPVSENITSRDQWVDQDEVFITNTLNKLLSPDEKLRTQGLDDLGYILPIFLINSLKGEELVVYLKAKLEAAKAVKHDMDKEREITERLKQATEKEEEFVEVTTEKKEENAKHLTMEQELPPEQGNSPTPTSQTTQAQPAEQPPISTTPVAPAPEQPAQSVSASTSEGDRPSQS